MAVDALKKICSEKGIPLALKPSLTDITQGLGSDLPPVYGLVLTSRKPDPLVDMPIVAGKAAPCPARIERVTAVPPTDFDPKVIDLVRAKADALKLSNMDMPSGAGHDAMHIAKLCPAGMIFVPCEGGISHNEIENAKDIPRCDEARISPRVAGVGQCHDGREQTDDNVAVQTALENGQRAEVT